MDKRSLYILACVVMSQLCCIAARRETETESEALAWGLSLFWAVMGFVYA